MAQSSPTDDLQVLPVTLEDIPLISDIHRGSSTSLAAPGLFAAQDRSLSSLTTSTGSGASITTPQIAKRGRQQGGNSTGTNFVEKDYWQLAVHKIRREDFVSS
jgi:hypothetical protein